MPRTEDIVRLRHMLDAARKAVEFTEGYGRTDLDKDEKLASSDWFRVDDAELTTVETLRRE